MSCSMNKYEDIMRAESEAEELEKNLYYRYMYNGDPVEDLPDNLLDNPPFGQQETKAQKRKQMPVYSGTLKYFPDALKEISKASLAGNIQHGNGDKLHWDRSKSKDDLDALVRHLIDHSVNPMDDDGILHLTKTAWRSLAALQKYLEGEEV